MYFEVTIFRYKDPSTQAQYDHCEFNEALLNAFKAKIGLHELSTSQTRSRLEQVQGFIVTFDPEQLTLNKRKITRVVEDYFRNRNLDHLYSVEVVTKHDDLLTFEDGVDELRGANGSSQSEDEEIKVTFVKRWLVFRTKLNKFPEARADESALGLCKRTLVAELTNPALYSIYQALGMKFKSLRIPYQMNLSPFSNSNAIGTINLLLEKSKLSFLMPMVDDIIREDSLEDTIDFAVMDSTLRSYLLHDSTQFYQRMTPFWNSHKWQNEPRQHQQKPYDRLVNGMSGK